MTAIGQVLVVSMWTITDWYKLYRQFSSKINNFLQLFVDNSQFQYPFFATHLHGVLLWGVPLIKSYISSNCNSLVKILCLYVLICSHTMHMAVKFFVLGWTVFKLQHIMPLHYECIWNAILTTVSFPCNLFWQNFSYCFSKCIAGKAILTDPHIHFDGKKNEHKR